MIKVKILKFVKTKPTDLSNNEVFNVIECGRDRYTLKECRKIEGHDDTLPYNAKLCLNGKPVCICHNDGWGGVTEIKALDIRSKAILSSMRLKVGQYKWSFNGTEFPLEVEFIADTLACGVLAQRG